MLNLIPSPIREYLAIGAIAVASFGAYLVYDAIYARGWDAHVILSEKEKVEMRKANEKAIANAEKTLREDIAILASEKEALENAAAELDREAVEDPDADTGGISADSVRRLNAIK